MFTQPELETFLAICIVLICLGAATDIYWILISRRIEAIRKTFARLVWRCRVESWVKGLRELVEDEG